MDSAVEGRLLVELGLRHVEPASLEIARVPCGRGFRYRDGSGQTIRDPALRARLAGLAIPPAWREVRIARDPHAHVQAVGRDELGRLQYIYHAEWLAVREAVKEDRLHTFGRSLPRIRERLDADLRRNALDRVTIVAAAVRLIERALLRPGYPSALGEEGGRGAATLLKRHVALEGSRIFLQFHGKGRRPVEKTVVDARLAHVLARLVAQPGTYLFKEVVGRAYRRVSADELNVYLKEVARADLTAKDFRTFYASSRALELLAPEQPARAKRKRQRQILGVARDVSRALQNTPAIARASYIHPLVLDAFAEGRLDPRLLHPPARRGLTAAETGLMRLLDASGP